MSTTMPTTPACASIMPAEIIEKILDQLHDDAPSLYSASLVCRAWVAAPRYHMFHRIVIREVDVPFRRAHMIEENIEGFLYLSRSPHCTFLCAMRCAILFAETPRLIPVIEVLARAEFLTHIIFNPGTDDAPAPPLLARALPNIQGFTYNMSNRSVLVEENWHLLASFGHLRTLAIHTSESHTVIFPTSVCTPFFPDLQKIEIQLAKSEEFFEWISKASPSMRIDTLDIRMIRQTHRGWGPVTALNSFLKQNSGTMKHLSLSVEYAHCENKSLRPVHNLKEDINLRPLTNLRTLFLQIHDIQSICDTILSIRSSSVESLMVHTGMWKDDRYEVDSRRECHCNFNILLTKLNGIMDTNHFTPGTKMLRFNIPLTDKPRYLGSYYFAKEIWVKWPDRGDLTFEDDLLYEYNKQRYTYSALHKARLLWWYVFQRPTLPSFLR